MVRNINVKMGVKVSDIDRHCLIGLVIRVLFSIYSVIHDKYFRLAYTDIDYKVYTYAAKQVLALRSPYEQQPYRYSPVIAYILTPNILVHPIWGKLLASVADVALAYCIYRVVHLVYNNQKKALLCAQLWLYNPFPVIICSRGNIDAVSSVCVLLTLLYQLKQNYFASGAFLALSVHLRLYPIIFLLPLLITAGRYSAEDSLKLTYQSKLKLVASFAVVLAALTGAFYYVYGFKFIDASIIYHVFRVDTRHNFSLYSYLQYLDPFVPDIISKNFPLMDAKTTKALLMLVPSAAVIATASLKYNTLNHLPFAFFCSAFTLVLFNKVVTAQYFIWYLSLLPLFLPSVVLSTKKVAAIVSLWSLTQAAWYLAAYLLEFQGYDTYALTYAAAISFFSVNVGILCIFINSYNDQHVRKIK